MFNNSNNTASTILNKSPNKQKFPRTLNFEGKIFSDMCSKK